MYVTSVRGHNRSVSPWKLVLHAFKSSNILRQSLVDMKSCIPPEKNHVAYEILCKDLKHLYIKEVRKIQVMEHTPTVRLQPNCNANQANLPGKKPTRQKAHSTHSQPGQPSKKPAYKKPTQPKASQPGPMPNQHKAMQPGPKSTWPKASQPGPLPTRTNANRNQSQPSPMSTWQPGPKPTRQPV